MAARAHQSKYDNGRVAMPVIERIRRNVAVDPSTGCWLWQGHTDRKWGYGKTYVGSRRDGTRRTTTAHAAAWEAVNGPVPDGLCLDHIACDTPPCCNPGHLRVTTIWENTRRSCSAPTAVNARKTECLKGHLLVGDNLRRNADGGRVCRTCTGWTGRVPIYAQDQTCEWCQATYRKRYRTACCSKSCAMYLRNA